MRLINLLRSAIVLAAVGLLAGCELVVLNPAGDIAAQQGRLIVVATALMLLIPPGMAWAGDQAPAALNAGPSAAAQEPRITGARNCQDCAE